MTGPRVGPHGVLITVPDPSKKKLANGRTALVAALEAAGLESREEKGIGTNPTGVKHRSPYSCPIPALTLHHFLTQPPTYPPISPPLSSARFSVLSAFTRMPPRFDVSLEKLTRVPCVSLTIAEALSACFSPLSALTVILFPSFCPPIYLSPRLRRPFPSYLFVYRSIPDFSLAVHFPSFFLPLPSSSDFLCKRPQVDL